MKRSFLILILVAGCAAEAPERRAVEITRTIGIVSPENRTSVYRWPMHLKFNGDGSEWLPTQCDEAIAEVKKLVAPEFLIWMRSVLVSETESARTNNGYKSRSRQLALAVEGRLDVDFPGEGGYLESMERKIQHTWARHDGASRSTFVASCKSFFGNAEPDALWYQLIFHAALNP